jgi:hypothetical protein
MNANGGMSDHRTAQFARDRHVLVVFKSRKAALARARKDTNEFWTGKV